MITKKTRLPLTIVIPCADDIRIKKCLSSIDEKVEILVVLNGATAQVKEIVKQFPTKIISIFERNLSKSHNIGIHGASYDKVILMDSDCIFESGAIRKIYHALGDRLIVSGYVVFEYNDYFSKLTALAREYSYYHPPKPYNPFIALNKKIKSKIGDKYFEEGIHWTEDADLHTRLDKANIQVKYVPEARVFHPPLTIFYDLRSAFRYGIGKRIRVEKKLAKGIGSHFNLLPEISQIKGFPTAFYFFFWNCFYSLGYYNQMMFDPYKTRSQ